MICVSPVSERRDKVKAAMYSIIGDISAIQTALISEKSLELVVDVLNYGTEAERNCQRVIDYERRLRLRKNVNKRAIVKVPVRIIDTVTVSRCIYHS